MSNKDIFKELYNKKINKKDNYNHIIIKLQTNRKKRSFKLILIPVCLIIVISFTLLTRQNMTKKTDSIINENDNIIVNINKLDNVIEGSLMLDIDVKLKSDVDSSRFTFLNELVLPNGLNNDSKLSAFYVKSNYEENNREVYDKLHTYIVIYKNENKKIQIKFSEDGYPLRDYVFEDTYKKSQINNTDVIIAEYKNIYLITFKYNDINFDVETSNITENELINFLTSIIK